MKGTPGAWRAVTLAWLANTLLGSLIGTGWLNALPGALPPRALAFVPAALASSVATLALLVAVPLGLLALALPARALALVQSLSWALFQLALFADTRIFRLFRYHFNGMVWNVMTTPGSEDAVDLGPRTIAIAVAIGAALFALELWIWTRWLRPREGGGRLHRAVPIGALGVLALVLFEKGTFALADLRRDRNVTALARLFPMYQRLTIETLARRLGTKLEERPKVLLGSEGLLLRYPTERPRIDPAGARPSFLVIVIDSLRADALDEETMPRTSAFAREGRRFADHLSGGNATRHGIFSMLYGIHGSYWGPALEEHAPPVLVRELQALGYDLRVISTPSMSFPEFRSTAWVTMEEHVEDHLPGATKHEKDASIPGRFERWLAARNSARPFFAFLLIDAPHGTYDWPREETYFRPCAERVDFLKMASSPTEAEIAEVRNSWRNAVRFADKVAGQALDVLRASGRERETVVVITGDHGEEFFENGHFGHTSSFAPAQMRVAFAMAGPGVPGGVETRPTSHIDLAPTFLRMCGADLAGRGSWTLGDDLLDPREGRLRVVADWDEVGLWTEGAILSLPLEGWRGGVEAYDYSWRRLEHESGAVRAAAPAIARLAEECRRFLR